MQKSKAEVIIPPNIKPAPFPHEVKAAIVLSQHFNCNIEFLQPRPGYKMKTPDFIMNGLAWELKCPQGKSKKTTIESCIRLAKQQSHYIIIDTHDTKLDDRFIIQQLKYQIKRRKSVKQIILIKKDNSVLALK